MLSQNLAVSCGKLLIHITYQSIIKRITNVDDVDDLTQSVYLSFAEQYQNINEPEKWLQKSSLSEFC
ncbi:MAG: hypothetical protein MZV64_24710 [Ignavibacteriales bacterium]|nr:hypothetical protein [Ignavibacteriales bacterium]